MTSHLLSIGVLLVGIVVGAIFGASVAIRMQERRRQAVRAQNDIPNLLGKWKCQWFDQEAPTREPTIEDVVEILWLRRAQASLLQRGTSRNFISITRLWVMSMRREWSRLPTKLHGIPSSPIAGLLALRFRVMETRWKAFGLAGGFPTNWVAVLSSVHESMRLSLLDAHQSGTCGLALSRP